MFLHLYVGDTAHTKKKTTRFITYNIYMYYINKVVLLINKLFAGEKKPIKDGS